MRRRVLAACVMLAMLASPAAGAASETSLRERQWGLDMIRAPETWGTTQGKGTIVAVVDTGVDLRHPDLAPRLLRDGDGEVVGLDLVDGGAPQDEHGHGTPVAGVVAAAGEEPGDLTGVAPETWIMPVRALDENGAGSGADIDEGIRWAVDNGANVVNLSLESAVPLPGQVVSTGPASAVQYAWERGVAVVAATGNTGTPFTDYPSSSPVLLVGATDRDDRRAAFSDGSRGDMVMAPGVDILSSACDPCGSSSRPTHREASGTSFAAPHVAGGLALLMAKGWDHEQAVASLRNTAVELSGAGSGHGRIDVAAALGIAGEEESEAEEQEREEASDPGAEEAAPTEADSDTTPASEPPPEPEAEQDTGEQEADTSDAPADEPPEPEEPPEEEDEDLEVRPEPPNGSEDVAAQDEVAVPSDGRGPRLGLLEGIATGLLGVTATAVGLAWRRWPVG
jgi:hypothetical protein